MEAIRAADLKSILHSKRANIYYLEHCRVLVNGGRVEYVTDTGKKQLYWNIPIANTTSILLGTGTSVTQAAMRELAKAGVLVGFAAAEAHRCSAPTSWMSRWPGSHRKANIGRRNTCRPGSGSGSTTGCAACRQAQAARLQCLHAAWTTRATRESGFEVDGERLTALLRQAGTQIDNAPDVTALLVGEAQLTKSLFKLAVDTVGYGDFTRAKRGGGTDIANRYLDHGNYLAYGLGATATWVLGLPHGLAVLHGKTRRGGLVFDAADLIKDAVILPQAFLSAMRGDDEQQFRRQCIEALTRNEALDFVIDTLKRIALKHRAWRPRRIMESRP